MLEYLGTLKASIFHPFKFFGRLPARDGLKHPFKFLLLNLIIREILKFVVDLSVLRALPNKASLFLVVSQFILKLPLILLLVAAAAGLLYLAVKTLKGSLTFTDSLKVLAYSSAPTILTPIYIIGAAAFLYQLFLVFCGLWLVQNGLHKGINQVRQEDIKGKKLHNKKRQYGK